MMVDFASGDSRAANTNLRIMRIMRMGRLARVVRVVRVVRLFRALRTLVASLVGNRSQPCVANCMEHEPAVET